MNSDDSQKERKYPFNMSRVYVNAVTAGLSSFMAITLLKDALLFSLFVIEASLVTGVVFFFKIRPIFRLPEAPEGETADLGKSISKNRFLFLMVATAAILATPLLLFLIVRFFPVEGWFILIAGLASGVGVSEVLYYIYCSRVVK